MSTAAPSNAAHSEGVTASRRNAAFAWAALGAVLSLGALAAAGHDLAGFVGTGRYIPATAGGLWFEVHVGSLNLVQAIVQRYVHPGLWDPLIALILRWPLWASLGGPGAALLVMLPVRRS